MGLERAIGSGGLELKKRRSVQVGDVKRGERGTLSPLDREEVMSGNEEEKVNGLVFDPSYEGIHANVFFALS